MHCKYCGFANSEDDHRCQRCGRRSLGVVIAAPPGYVGANALAAEPVFQPNDTQEVAQPPLFDASPRPVAPQKVIPFDQLHRQVTGRLAGVQPPPPPAKQAPSSPRAARKSAAPPVEQGTLDFIQTAASPRTLKTKVEAQIYCEQPVATPMHRFIASAMDAAMILLGFGVFVVAAQGVGGAFGTGKMFWIAMGVSFALISMFYGLIWAIAGRETAGMRWTDLQLITFDGFAVDGRSRAVRFASTWLSFCSGGLGLVWALADEENLTWHDHISKTFPAIRDLPGSFVRQRR